MTLDARRKAMLREMGVRLWWPTRAAAAKADASPPATQQAASEPPDRRAAPQAAADPLAAKSQGATPQRSTGQSPGAAVEPAVTATAQGQALHWRVGDLQALHSPSDGHKAPRWLLLSEQRQEGGPGGQAAELLQRMLRAARLHQGSQVWLAPMLRSPPGASVTGLESALAVEPDLVFIMGRLAAQALLETDEPLGRLRGQVHELWGLPAIVSYDCVTLLRSPADKAKAWDDLCLALQVAREQHAQRLASESD